MVVMFSLAQISADPADINVLPEYSNDPRVVQNLLDGVNQTRDDLHMWLAPFSPGRPHTVSLTFASPTTLALVRIWVSARTCDPNVSVISLVWIEVDFVALQYEWLYQLFEELMMLYDVSEWLVVCSSPVRTITSLVFTRTGVLGLWRCTLMQRSSSEERLQSENPGGGGVRCGMYSVRCSFFGVSSAGPVVASWEALNHLER